MFKNYLNMALLCMIVAISFIGNLYVFETNNTETIGRFQKTIILAIWFFSIAFFGLAVLQSTKRKWVITLWVFQYALALLICIVYIGFYFLAANFPIAIKTAMASIRNFYLTPIPLALLILMTIVENKKSSN